jgi:pimeloyl-ACP methyl ester carboxylesterase
MAHRSEMISVRGVSTHLLRGGRGAPLLVLPPQFAADRWFPYHDALAARFQVLAPDHLGFGRSERPDWLSGIDDLILHYADLLDLLGLERVSLMGLSLGGWIAAEFAAWFPHRVEKLVLVDAAGLKVDGVPRFDVFTHPIEETLQRLFYDQSRWPQLVTTDLGPEVIVRAYRETTTLARLTWNPYMYNPKLARRLARITAPTLVVWGADDAFLPLPHGVEYARLIPAARLVSIPQCGHFPPFEQSAVFLDHVTSFLEARDGAPS